MTSKKLLKISTLLVISYIITLFLWLQIQSRYDFFLFNSVYNIAIKHYSIIDHSIEYNENNTVIKIMVPIKISKSEMVPNNNNSFVNSIFNHIANKSEITLPIIIKVPKIESFVTKYTPISLAIFFVYVFNFKNSRKTILFIEVAIILFTTHTLIMLTYFILTINNNINSFEILLNKSALTTSFNYNNKIINEILSIVYSYLTDFTVYFEPFLIGIFLYKKYLYDIKSSVNS